MKYLPLLMLAPLLRLIVTDFRHREVSVMWLGILAIGTLCIPVIQYGLAETIVRSAYNLLLILYLGAGVVLWGWLKARKFVNPINSYIGLGDLLFFIILIPLFPLRQYAYLLVGCMVFSLIWWWTAILFRRVRRPSNIPLIATSGIVISAAIIYQVFFE